MCSDRVTLWFDVEQLRKYTYVYSRDNETIQHAGIVPSLLRTFQS